MKRFLHLELEGRRTAKIVRTAKTAKLVPGEVMMMVEGIYAEEPVDDMRFVVLPVKDAFDDTRYDLQHRIVLVCHSDFLAIMKGGLEAVMPPKLH